VFVNCERINDGQKVIYINCIISYPSNRFIIKLDNYIKKIVYKNPNSQKMFFFQLKIIIFGHIL